MLAHPGEDSKTAFFFFWCSYNKLLKTTKAVLYLFFVELFEVRYVAHLRYASTLNVEAAVFSETSLPVKLRIRYQKTIMSLLC